MKNNLTPLWKHVARLEGGLAGGTTKFTCPHCKITYTSPYTCVRKHLCRLLSSDETKNIGITTYTKVQKEYRKKIYQGRVGSTK